MSPIVIWLGRVAACLAIVSACDSGGGSDDSSTHWLEDCASTVDCGEGPICICGVCTKTCTTTADCAAVAPGAECLAPASASCSGDLVCGIPGDASTQASGGAPSAGGTSSGGQSVADASASGSAGGTATTGGAAGTGSDAAAGRDAGAPRDASSDGWSQDGATDALASDAMPSDATPADATPADAITAAQGWEGERIVSGDLSYMLVGNVFDQVGVAADGTAFVLFQMRSGPPSDAVYVNRYVPGVGWDAAPVVVNPGFGGPYGVYATLSVSENGDAMAVWLLNELESDGGLSPQVYAARYAGAWEPPVLIGASPHATTLSVAADAHGRFIVAWMDAQNEGATAPASLHVSRYEAPFGWEPPLHVPSLYSQLDPLPYSPRPASIAMNREGSAIVAWSERLSTGPQSGTGWVRVERFTPGVGWSSPDLLSGPFPATSGNIPCYGALDHGGRAAVLWTEGDPPDLPDAAPVVSPPSHPMAATFDGTWSAPARLDPTEGALPVVGPTPIATDSNGHFMAGWVNRIRVGQSMQYSVHAARLTFGGSWSSPTALHVPQAAPDGGELASLRSSPFIYMSEDGTAIASWMENAPSASMWTIEAAHFAPATGWGAPTTLAPTVFVGGINGGMDANGNGTFVWRSSGDFLGWSARYTSGVGWEAPVTISTGNASFISSAVGAGGEVVAMWYDNGVKANVYR